MLSTRFTSIALLVFYGIPVAIGPHWHHHHGAHHHHGDSGDCARSGCDAACQAVVTEAAHCTCSHEAPAANDQSPAQESQAIDGQASGESLAHYAAIVHDGPCAICDFYSSAQSQSRASIELTDNAVTVPLALHVSAVLSRAVLCQWARGPPSV